MPVSKSRKKSYNPTRTLQKLAIARSRKASLNSQDVLQLKLTSNSALKLVLEDTATVTDYTLLQGAFTVAVMTSKMFYGSHLTELNSALNLVTEAVVYLNSVDQGRAIMEEHEKSLLIQACAVHDAQLDNMTNEDLCKVLKRLDSELKHKAKNV